MRQETKDPSELTGTSQNGEWRLVPVDQLEESKTNPRKTYHAIEELAESIKAHGILQPLVVRPKSNGHPTGGRYEIVAGARRFRASRLADLNEVPVIVRELSDRDVLEIQVIENCQRQDVHPLEEADGYKRLIEGMSYDVPTLAAKIGKSESYVYSRLCLNGLGEPLRDLFWAEKIHLGHATILARLQKDDQVEARKWLLEQIKWNQTVAASRLNDYVQSEFHLNLHAAAFRKDDAELGAGPCTTCPKRTGFSPSLWPDVKAKDVCTDRACFRAKEQAHVEKQKKKLEAQGADFILVSTRWRDRKTNKDVLSPEQFDELTKKEAKTAPAKEVKTALVVDGEGCGKVIQVRLRGARRDSGADPYKAQQRAEREKRKLQEKINAAVLDAILEDVKAPVDQKAMRDLANAFFDLVDHDTRMLVCKRRGWQRPKGAKPYMNEWMGKAAADAIDGFTPAQLHQFLVECSLARYVKAFTYGDATMADALKSAAKDHGVDAAAIVTHLKTEAKEKAGKKKGKKKKLAKRKEGKSKGQPVAGTCRVCGCTDDAACEGGCAWVDKKHTLCSSCAGVTRRPL